MDKKGIGVAEMLASVKPTEDALNEALDWVLEHCDGGLWIIDTGEKSSMGCKASPPNASMMALMLTGLVQRRIEEMRKDKTMAGVDSMSPKGMTNDEFGKLMAQLRAKIDGTSKN
jgi:hypothetical protein